MAGNSTAENSNVGDSRLSASSIDAHALMHAVTLLVPPIVSSSVAAGLVVTDMSAVHRDPHPRQAGADWTCWP